MIGIRSHPEGAVLAVRVQPGASRDRIAGEHGDRLKVAVAAPPEKGKANEAVLGVLARRLGVRVRELRLLAGLTGRDKEILVLGATPEELRERLTETDTTGDHR
ncbi:MAG: DUF167 domain-containing protein [Planctomycetes bacterium]|nr:DUF167 domain-containing protein [Planctomycetota bacterium]